MKLCDVTWRLKLWDDSRLTLCPARFADKSVPLEYGLDALNGVSYKKGCYVGQERVSFSHYRGVIRKRCTPFRTVSAGEHLGCREGSRTSGMLLTYFPGSLKVSRIQDEDLTEASCPCRFPCCG